MDRTHTTALHTVSLVTRRNPETLPERAPLFRFHPLRSHDVRLSDWVLDLQVTRDFTTAALEPPNVSTLVLVPASTPTDSIHSLFRSCAPGAASRQRRPVAADRGVSFRQGTIATHRCGNGWSNLIRQVRISIELTRPLGGRAIHPRPHLLTLICGGPVLELSTPGRLLPPSRSWPLLVLNERDKKGDGEGAGGGWPCCL